MACGIRCSKGLKICCGVTIILIILLLVTFVVLFFTVFKPKEPIIIFQPVKVVGFESIVWPVFELNVSLGIVATVKNRNHGSFSYEDSKTTVDYRGNLVGEGPIHGDTIPELGELNMSTIVTIFADKLAKDQNFLDDFKSGVLNFTSSSTLHGKVRILRLFKMKATSFNTCYISLFTIARTTKSTCNSKIKI